MVMGLCYFMVMMGGVVVFRRGRAATIPVLPYSGQRDHGGNHAYSGQ